MLATMFFWENNVRPSSGDKKCPIALELLVTEAEIIWLKSFKTKDVDLKIIILITVLIRFLKRSFFTRGSG